MAQAWKSFACRLKEEGTPLTRAPLEVLQVNVGKLCNQACKHCHVDAGPWRTELMSRDTMHAVLKLARASKARTLDITGGAPELNPDFRWLVQEAKKLGMHVIDRCNLTVLFEPGQEDLGEFLRDQEVEVVASMPCYLEDNVNRQRGGGVYQKSIDALKKLNQLGYGKGNARLRLNLVYNPSGPSLPPDQVGLEADYKRELSERFGIEFDKLYTITNMPIHRFRSDLERKGTYDAYMETLTEAHRGANVAGVMCRNQLSIGWEGFVFDCDFNQMLGMALNDPEGRPLHVSDLSLDELEETPIRVADHCFGCTAGAGSSCGGALE